MSSVATSAAPATRTPYVLWRTEQRVVIASLRTLEVNADNLADVFADIREAILPRHYRGAALDFTEVRTCDLALFDFLSHLAIEVKSKKRQLVLFGINPAITAAMAKNRQTLNELLVFQTVVQATGAVVRETKFLRE